MKAALKAATEIVNPLFDERLANKAKKAGLKYSVPQMLQVAAGHVISDPEVWINCCPGLFNAEPTHVPADEECRQKVLWFMETRRPELIAHLKDMLENIDTFTDPAQRVHIMESARAYGLLPGTSDAHAGLASTLKKTGTEASADDKKAAKS